MSSILYGCLGAIRRTPGGRNDAVGPKQKDRHRCMGWPITGRPSALVIFLHGGDLTKANNHRRRRMDLRPASLLCLGEANKPPCGSSSPTTGVLKYALPRCVVSCARPRFHRRTSPLPPPTLLSVLPLLLHTTYLPILMTT